MENIGMEITETPTPKIIFIVPYRDRQQQYEFFSKQMASVLAGVSHRILYIHQTDQRPFNRGALKNIGFLTVKSLYPDTYTDITLVFNDIDTMPYTAGFFDYETQKGVVKHFYGFTFALGGIVSINAADFERINGFPNFWAWGYEDNLLNQRVNQYGIRIDRSKFYPILDKNILHLQDGVTRSVNRTEYDIYKAKTQEGINTLSGVSYAMDGEFVNVAGFSTGRELDMATNKTHDLRTGNVPFPTTRRKAMMGMRF
jgi:hypothetical protein